MRRRFWAGLAVAAACAFASPAQAITIIDTFGPGNTYDDSYAYTVGETIFGTFISAAAFTLTSVGTINDVAVAAMAENFTLVITGDNAGLPDGIVLGTVSNGFTVDGFIDFDPSITLSAGTYWLLMAGVGDFSGGWYPNIEDHYGPFRQTDTNGATWIYGSANTFLPAFRIGAADVSEVPEPATLTLIGAGLLGIGALRRKLSSR